MNELEYLRKNWVDVTSEITFANTSSPDDNVKFMSKLVNLEGFQKKINRLKMIAVSLILSSFIITIYISGITSVLVYAGTILVIISTITFMTYYLRNQFDSSRLDYVQSSSLFAKEAIEALNKQNKIFGLPFILFILFMIIGANMIFAGINPGESIFFHIIFSIIIAASGSVGLLVRRWRTKGEIDPLINELSKLENVSD